MDYIELPWKAPILLAKVFITNFVATTDEIIYYRYSCEVQPQEQYLTWAHNIKYDIE